MSKENQEESENEELEEFNISPNFEYEEDIIDYAENTFALIDSFEAFKSIKDGKSYIVYQNKENKSLEILKILKNKYKLVATIEGHKAYITSIKYFLNESKKKEYLISSDYNGYIIITNFTDISEEYIPKCAFKTEFENGQITCCLMLFKLNSNILSDTGNGLIFISSRNSKEENKISLLSYVLGKDDKGIFKADLINVSNKTSYILYWDNKKLKKDYLIDIGHKKTVIIGIVDNEDYAIFINELEAYHHCGFIYNDEMNNNDLLYITSTQSYVFVYDLYEKNLIQKIKTSSVLDRLYSIIQWNKNYIIVSNSTKSCINVIDIKQGKFVGTNFIAHEDDFRCVKKIKHPKFGYCILTGGDDYTIKLYKPRNI